MGESRKHVRFRKDDFISENTTLPLRLWNLEFAVTVWRDASGSLRTLQLHCFPFRVVASVHVWHHFGAPVQFVFGQLVS